MKRYTVGFIFNPDFSQVLLVHKNRPDWQVGRLNGCGGKIEAGESDVEAMVRECREETALEITTSDWFTSCTTSGPDWEVVFLGAVWNGDPDEAKTMTDEEIAWYSTQSLPDHVIDNLRWLVPMAANKLQAVDELATATVQYRQ